MTCEWLLSDLLHLCTHTHTHTSAQIQHSYFCTISLEVLPSSLPRLCYMWIPMGLRTQTQCWARCMSSAHLRSSWKTFQRFTAVELAGQSRTLNNPHASVDRETLCLIPMMGRDGMLLSSQSEWTRAGVPGWCTIVRLYGSWIKKSFTLLKVVRHRWQKQKSHKKEYVTEPWCGPQSPKYLPPDPWWKKFADPEPEQHRWSLEM